MLSTNNDKANDLPQGEKPSGSKLEQVYLARVPIYVLDDLTNFAYEVQAGVPEGVVGDIVTETDIVNAALNRVTFNEFFDKAKAWIPIKEKKIFKNFDLPFDKRRTVLHLPSDMETSSEMFTALNKFTKRGTLLAVNEDVMQQKMHPLSLSANIVVFNLKDRTPEQITESFYRARRESMQYCAFNVARWEQADLCRKLGFHYVTGHFLYRQKKNATIDEATRTQRFAILQLLAKLQDPAVQIDDVDKIITRDRSISGKLLSYINSPAFKLQSKIASVQQALVLLGLNALRRWLIVAVLTEISTESTELIRMALIRAKMCELLGKTQKGVNTDKNFLVGLFSALDAIVGLPLEEVVQRLNLEEKIGEAITNFRGAGGIALYCAKAYERGAFEKLGKLPYTREVVTDAYLKSLKWAHIALASFIRQS